MIRFKRRLLISGSVVLFILFIIGFVLMGKNQTVSQNQSSEKKLVGPGSSYWLYFNGPWKEINDPKAGKVMKGWLETKQSPQYGRRAAIETNSSFAILKQRGIGGSVTVFLDGKPVVNKELDVDGEMIQIPIYKNKTGWHKIEIAFSTFSEIDGLYISTDAKAKKPADNKKKLIVIGHSYVEGMGAKNIGLNSFPSLLGDILKVQSINQGIGKTDVDVSVPASEKNSGLERVQSDVIQLKPDYVLSVYGFNAIADILGGDKSHAQYQADYTKFLKTIADSLPDVKLFASGIPATPSYSDEVLVPFNLDIKNACSSVSNCMYVDFAGKWNENNFKKYLTYDRIHPSVEGHKFLAHEYAKVISAGIKK